MIDIITLIPDYKGRRVIYRMNGEGAPEYATVVDWDTRRIHIIIDGDHKPTLVRSNEVSWVVK